MPGVSYFASSFLQRAGLFGHYSGAPAVERARSVENIPEPEDHPIGKGTFLDVPNCFTSRSLPCVSISRN